MTSLVGNAQEEDDAFWGHDTWAEDDSGNESFRDSDQDSTLRKDEFDSDFNDSETDNDQEEEAAGQQEERELQRQERSNRQGKSTYSDTVKPSRGGIMQKPKRAMGTGINSGLVLNLPPSMLLSSTAASTAVPGPALPTLAAPELVASLPPPAPSPTTQGKRSRMTNELGMNPTLATARQRRSQTKKRDSRNSTPFYSDSVAHPSNKRPHSLTGVTRKSKRRQYMQEELLVEAVKETEPENQRWLLARKRVQESADQDKDAMAALREKHRGKKVIQKYHSRRGCLITLTFPDMDAVPELLTRKSEPPKKPERLICAITGQPARYRDPKTGKGYLDSEAFKELRRRHDAGLSLDQRPKSKPKPKPKEEDAVSVNGVSSSANEAKPSPKPTGFVLDLGGDKKSPGSTRSSGRKWKPSEKMLEGMGIARDDSTSPQSAEKMDDSVLADAPPLPPITSSSIPVANSTTSAATLSLAAKASSSLESSAEAQIAETQNSGPVIAPTNHTSGTANHKTKKTGLKRTTNVQSTSAASQAGRGAANAKSTAAAAAASQGTTSLIGTKTQFPISIPSEQVYIIPGGSDDGSDQPRYVTQSELIMQAISNYNRSTLEKKQLP
jgi:hypothetical protein